MLTDGRCWRRTTAWEACVHLERDILDDPILGSMWSACSAPVACGEGQPVILSGRSNVGCG